MIIHYQHQNNEHLQTSRFATPTTGKKTTLGRGRTSKFCGDLLWNRSCGIITLETPLFSMAAFEYSRITPCSLTNSPQANSSVLYMLDFPRYQNSFFGKHSLKVLESQTWTNNYFFLTKLILTFMIKYVIILAWKQYTKIDTIWGALQIKSRLPFWMTQSISAPKLE